jgi:predicted xylose isomerase-like sugar epimerase
MAEIVALKTRPDEINEQVVAMARELLADAEAGRINALAYAALRQDGASDTASSATDNFQSLIGAVSILQFRMIEEMQT